MEEDVEDAVRRRLGRDGGGEATDVLARTRVGREDVEAVGSAFVGVALGAREEVEEDAVDADVDEEEDEDAAELLGWGFG